MHVHVYSVIETRQSKATTSKDNSSLFPKRKKRNSLRWDLSLHILHTGQIFYQQSHQGSSAGQAKSNTCRLIGQLSKNH